MRLVFRLFMEGKTFSAIAKHLVDQGIPTPAGKKTWQPSVVQSILTNEKYKGHALLQKTVCADFLTKKMIKNNGRVQQYYVEGSHPAIVDPSEFDSVQAEIERRKRLGRPTSCTSIFASKIVCADCGGRFGKKVWGSDKEDKTHRREIWRCNEKYKTGKGRQTPYVTEDDIKARFLAAFNSLFSNRDALIARHWGSKALGKKPFDRDDDDDDDPPSGGKTRMQSTTDPDSGQLSKEGKPDGFHYSEHRTVDSKHNVIVNIHITPANINDITPVPELLEEIERRLGHLPRYMGFDAGYHSASIAHLLETKGIQGVIGCRRHTRKGEHYGKYRFKYDPTFDTYLCPEGKHLYWKTTTREGYRQYMTQQELHVAVPDERRRDAGDCAVRIPARSQGGTPEGVPEGLQGVPACGRL